MNVVIRAMIVEDLEQVVAIDQASFSLPWPARSFHFELNDNQAARCWVAEQDGQVAAMLVGWLIVDELHVATLATRPEFRGQGIGTQILSHALRAAKEEGAIKAFLEVRESNKTAQKIYHEFGFVEDGRRKGYYKDNGEDAVLMSLDHLPEGA